MAIIISMNISTAEARNRFTELIRIVEDGEQVVITRHGRPVAQLAPPPPERRKARLGGMRDRIRLLPGWDDPITEEELIGENG
jgi:prevent-host-death family protein